MGKAKRKEVTALQFFQQYAAGRIGEAPAGQGADQVFSTRSFLSDFNPISGHICTLAVLVSVLDPAPDSLRNIGENGRSAKDDKHFGR